MIGSLAALLCRELTLGVARGRAQGPSTKDADRQPQDQDADQADQQRPIRLLERDQEHELVLVQSTRGLPPESVTSST